MTRAKRFCRSPPSGTAGPFQLLPIPLYGTHFVVFCTAFFPGRPAATATLERMPQTSADNPLLSLGFRVPFDHIRAEHVEPAAVELLSEARTRLDAVAAEPGERTFANTMQA